LSHENAQRLKKVEATYFPIPFCAFCGADFLSA